MRKLYFIFLMILGLGTNAQVFWTEDFGTNPVCGTVVASAYSGTNGAWTTSLTGTNQGAANNWYVSPKEAGTGVGNCGDDCTTNPTLINRSLHISTNIALFGDIGAAYAAGPGANTDIRAQSPNINTAGQSNIVMSFTYFVVGVVNQDFCEMMYSANGGLTWAALGIAPQTTLGTCSPQGKWTTHSVSLPAVCNNTNNVRVGFRWQNVSSTGGDPCIAIDAITLAQSATPSLTVTYTMQTAICRGDSTQVTAITSPTTASSYSWTSLPVGPIFSAPSASVTWIKYPTAGTFSITVAAQSGTQIATHTRTILVNPTPTVNVSTTNSAICPGGTTSINASSSTPGLSYTWAPITSTQPSVVVSPSITTTYSVTGTNSVTGCKGKNTIVITVHPLPNVGVTSSTLNVCTGSTATLTATGGTAYTWMPSGSGSTLLITPSVNTTYTVTGTSSLGCTNTATIAITTSTCSGSSGLNAYSVNELPFSVYPNPAKDKITIKAGDVNLNNVKIELFDVTGKKVLEQNFNSLVAGSEQDILVADLTKGIYILNMKVDGVAQKSVRLVKE